MAYAHEIGQALLISPPQEGKIRVATTSTAPAIMSLVEFAGREVEIQAEGAHLYVLLSRHSLAAASATATTGLTRTLRIAADQSIRVRLRPGVDNVLAYVTDTGTGFLRVSQSSDVQMADATEWTPQEIVGLTAFTGWWRADEVTLVSGAVSVVADKLGGANTLIQASAGNRPVPWTPGGTANQSYPALVFDGVDDYLSGAALSSLIANNLGTIITFFQPTAAPTDTTDAFTNTCIVSDSVGDIALGVRSSGFLIAGNDDGSNDSAQIAVPSATGVIGGVWRHTGGNLFVRAGTSALAGSQASVASGNTASLAGFIYIGRTSSIFMPCRWMETLVFNQSVPEDLFQAIAAYGRRRYGVPSLTV